MSAGLRETLLGKLVLVLSRETPEELEAIYRFATGRALPDKDLEGPISTRKRPTRNADGGMENAAYVFR